MSFGCVPNPLRLFRRNEDKPRKGAFGHDIPGVTYCQDEASKGRGLEDLDESKIPAEFRVFGFCAEGAGLISHRPPRTFH